MVWKPGVRDKRVQTFPKVISPTVNVIAWLWSELTYNEVTVQHVNHYAPATQEINS